MRHRDTWAMKVISSRVSPVDDRRARHHSRRNAATAGRSVTGFQLWINLPAAEAGQCDIADTEMPRLDLPSGGQVKIIAGEVSLADEVLVAPVKGGVTDPLYLDVVLRPDESLAVPIKSGYGSFLYVFEGDLLVAGETVSRDHLATLTDGNSVTVQAGKKVPDYRCRRVSRANRLPNTARS